MKKSQKVRYAVIGAGNIAQVAVLPAFRHAASLSQLVAIVSSDSAKLKTLGKRYRVNRLLSYDEFDGAAAAGEFDAVYIALPNHLHREWTERAAAHGLHVLCEKPMALDEADCEAMIAATRDAGVRLMIAYRLHFEPTTLRAIQLVRSGKIGTPRLFTSMFTHVVRPNDIRKRGVTGGGALYDLGVYCINAARHLFDAEPIEVFAQLVDSHNSDGALVDDTVAATLRFGDGATAQFSVGQSSAPASTLRISGTRGMLHMDSAYEYSEAMTLKLTVNDKTTTLRTPRRDQFAPELDYFSRCVREHREPMASGREGLADVRIIQALLESAQLGRPVGLLPAPKPDQPPRQPRQYPPVKEQDTIHAPSPEALT